MNIKGLFEFRTQFPIPYSQLQAADFKTFEDFWN